jgi:hypothetical protein
MVSLSIAIPVVCLAALNDLNIQIISIIAMLFGIALLFVGDNNTVETHIISTVFRISPQQVLSPVIVMALLTSMLAYKEGLALGIHLRLILVAVADCSIIFLLLMLWLGLVDAFNITEQDLLQKARLIPNPELTLIPTIFFLAANTGIAVLLAGSVTYWFYAIYACVSLLIIAVLLIYILSILRIAFAEKKKATKDFRKSKILGRTFPVTKLTLWAFMALLFSHSFIYRYDGTNMSDLILFGLAGLAAVASVTYQLFEKIWLTRKHWKRASRVVGGIILSVGVLFIYSVFLHSFEQLSGYILSLPPSLQSAFIASSPITSTGNPIIVEAVRWIMWVYIMAILVISSTHYESVDSLNNNATVSSGKKHETFVDVTNKKYLNVLGDDSDWKKAAVTLVVVLVLINRKNSDDNDEEPNL